MMQKKNHGKRGLRLVLFAAVLLAGLLLFSAASAEDWMAEARKMLTLVNDFRTGSDTWCWDKTDTKKEYTTGLAPLAYDLELEKVALVRARELAVKMSHTRPDGRKWSTAYPAGNYAKGENIACGYRTAEDTFIGFREDDEPYSGQGHRRIMLKKELTRVGFAAVEVDGVVYWAQEFASGAVKSPLPADTGWTQENGAYYYVKDDGSKATGWLQDSGKWYYLNASGVMQTGWTKVSGKWYYFSKDGDMQTGWTKIGGKWYYFSDDGPMQTGWQKISRKWYYFDDDGVMQEGWQKIDGKWYYLGDGVMQTGWKELSGKWYYFKSSGEMVTGRVTIQGQIEVFDASGAWQYSEIPDYETPLGGSFSLNNLIRLIIQFLNSLFG